jgi:PAS domain S-box-containing protein
MDKEFRTVGIPGIGETPWGTHCCQFYETKEGLMDLLIPYFKAGLENNEFCLWVTSDPLDDKSARNAMIKAVPQFDRYVKDGQIEIVPYTEWYLEDGDFDLQRVLQRWIEKLNHALARGYDGMRVTGNTTWLDKARWKDFTEYEQAVNTTIEKYKMLALCTYALDKCKATAVLDVVQYHQFALIERKGTWERIESAELRRTKAELTELKQAEQALKKSQSDLAEAQRVAKIGNWSFDHASNRVMWSDELYRIFGISKSDFAGTHESFLSRVHPDDQRLIVQMKQQALTEGKPFDFEYRILLPNGELKMIREVGYASKDAEGKVVRLFGTAQDITERKEVEDRLLASHEQLRILSRRLLDAHEEERKRIARELHDETGQSLMSLLVGLRTIKDSRTLNEAKAQAARLRKVTSQAMKEVQRLAHGLRPSMLDDMGLEAALKRYASDFAHAYRIAVEVDTIGLDGERLPAPMETALFRIAQEALTNIVKHAAAKQVSILLNRHVSDIQMIVEDDGIGIELRSDPKTAPSSFHLGLYGMSERVSMLGGTIAVESARRKGTTIHARIPLERKTT